MTNRSSGRPFDPAATVKSLQALLDEVTGTTIDAEKLSHKWRRELREKINSAIAELERVSADMSLVRLPSVILDPSEPHVIGKLIADVLLEQERHPLAAVPRFYGSGVYALYYTGQFDAYLPASGTETPLYVGKADPATPNAADAREQGEKLYTRLNDHRRSINAAHNLDIDDFECRYLVVKSAWQNTAETYLINGFKPIWNDEVGICFGIGKHGDKASTRTNTRSPWDTLHPGRKWALTDDNIPNPQTADDIKRAIADHYRKHRPTSASVLPPGAAPEVTDDVSEE